MIEFDLLLFFLNCGVIFVFGMGVIEIVWLWWDELFWENEEVIWYLVGVDVVILIWINL